MYPKETEDAEEYGDELHLPKHKESQEVYRKGHLKWVDLLDLWELQKYSSPPIYAKALSLQVTSCHCWQHRTDFFLLRYSGLSNGIHGFAIPKASSMRHKLPPRF